MTSKAQSLRDLATKLRRTPMPLVDVIPTLQAAADEIDELHSRAAVAALSKPEPKRCALTDEQIDEWWRKDNGMEDLDPCERLDFHKIVRLVEEGLAARALAASTGRAKP